MMLMLRIKSPAKINLFLYIIERNKEGYHKLQSLFCLIPTLFDEMIFEDSEELKIICDKEIQDNIILKAAEKIGINKGIQITVKKTIPIGAGLGGGSSNAAKTLLTLNERFNLNLSLQNLIDTRLGDDVEFFLMEKPTVYFDDVNRTEISLGITLHILLVKPDFSLSTQAVYQAFRELMSTQNLKPIINKNNLIDYIYNGDNNLYIAAQKVNANICYVMQQIQSQKSVVAARMTGSGSTCFGIFESFETAQIAMHNMIKNNPSWFFHLCTLTI